MKSEEKMISIIIPVYNTEKYIERCIQSVYNQTFTNYELILINDGSTDNSGEIVEKLALKGEAVVKHIKNSGVSAARNLGIELATGNYIVFIDADDYIESDYLEKLLNAAEYFDAEIVVCGRTTVFETNNKERCESVENGIFIGKDKEHLIQEMLGYSYDDMKRWLKCSNFSRGTVVWARLYKTELLKKNNIKFELDVKIGEDMLFNTKAYVYANKVVQLEYCGYYYFQHEESALHRYLGTDYDYLIENKCLLAVKRDELASELKKHIDIRYMYAGSLVLSCGEIAVSLENNKKYSFFKKLDLYKSYSGLEPVRNARKEMPLSGLSIKYKLAMIFIKYNFVVPFILGLECLNKFKHNKQKWFGKKKWC